MSKPKLKLLGKDGNVFNLIGLAVNALKKAGQKENAEKMSTECFSCRSYDEAIGTIMDYCEVS